MHIFLSILEFIFTMFIVMFVLIFCAAALPQILNNHFNKPLSQDEINKLTDDDRIIVSDYLNSNNKPLRKSKFRELKRVQYEIEKNINYYKIKKKKKINCYNNKKKHYYSKESNKLLSLFN